MKTHYTEGRTEEKQTFRPFVFPACLHKHYVIYVADKYVLSSDGKYNCHMHSLTSLFTRGKNHNVPHDKMWYLTQHTNNVIIWSV